MPDVCVDRNLSITAGRIGLAPWSVPRIVLDQTFNSTGDGALNGVTSLPGRLMIDSGILSWTNDSPLPANMLVRVGRSYRNLVASNPNYVQIRDRWTTATGARTPRVPDVSSVFQSQFGGAYDYATNVSATPSWGVLYIDQDAHITEDWAPSLASGDTFKVWYRAYAWNPPPFSNNGNYNNNVNFAYVRSTRIQLWAFPTQDTAVVNR